MMVLQGLQLKLGAIFRLEPEPGIAPLVAGYVFVKARLVIFVERGIAKRPLPVRPAFGIHLQEAQVYAQLDLLSPILGLEPTDYDLPRLVLPLVQEVRYVEIHAPNMNGVPVQVNATGIGGTGLLWLLQRRQKLLHCRGKHFVLFVNGCQRAVEIGIFK